MYSEVMICNMALGEIGGEPIVSLTEQSKEAIACNTHLIHARQLVLQSHEWQFATKTAKLSLVDVEIQDWPFVYAYPTGCLVVRRIFNTDTPKGYNEEFTIQASTTSQAKYVLARIEKPSAVFTYDVEDATMFTPNFVEALMYKLASKICYQVTGNRARAQEMENQFMKIVPMAQAINLNEQNQKDPYRSTLQESR